MKTFLNYDLQPALTITNEIICLDGLLISVNFIPSKMISMRHSGYYTYLLKWSKMIKNYKAIVNEAACNLPLIRLRFSAWGSVDLTPGLIFIASSSAYA